MVSIDTFRWRSLCDLRTHPRSSSAVMMTVVATVATFSQMATRIDA